MMKYYLILTFLIFTMTMCRQRVFTGFMSQDVTPVIQEADVLIIAGQSNARGNTGGVDPLPPFVLPNDSAFIVGLNNSNGTEVTNFELLDFDQGNALGQTHGPELGFAYYYGQEKNKPVYIVKVSQGGTSLAVNWASGSLLRNKLIEYINKAKTDVQNPVFHFYWNQWEAESRSVTNSNNYQSNYRAFIDDILNQTGVEFKSHIIQKANPNSNLATENPANYQTILTAQTNNAAFYDGVLLDNDVLPLFDGVHYGSEELHEIGNDLSDIINR